MKRQWMLLALGLLGGSYLMGLFVQVAAPDTHTLRGHTAGVTSVAFTPDGQTLASAALDGTIRLWSVRERRVFRIIVAGGALNGIAFAPDGQTVAAGGADATVRLWRVADGALLRVFSGHTAVQGVAFTPDGALLAAATMDGRVRLWRVADGTLVRRIDTRLRHLTSMALNPDGVRLAVGGEEGVKQWSVLTGEEVPMSNSLTLSTTQVAYSLDGQVLAAAGPLVIDEATHRISGWVSIRDLRAGSRIGIINMNGGPRMTAFAFGASEQLVTVNQDAEVWLSAPLSNHQGQRLGRHHAPVTTLSSTLDGTLAASGAQDGTIELWTLPPVPPLLPTTIPAAPPLPLF